MDQSSKSRFNRREKLYILLSAVFLSNAILAEIIGVKIFSLEKLLNLPPAQLDFFSSFKLDFNLTAGVVLWPVVFITSDMINEYFGKNGVKRISYLTAVIIVYVFGALFTATQLPAADFWLELNQTDAEGHPLNINGAFATIFRQGLGIILGSITAFLIGQILDAHTFQWIRSITGSRMLWLRATGSTLISQFIDSYVVLWVAFFVFGNWPMEQVLAVGTINYIYKFAVAIGLTPLLYPLHYFIDKYLEK